MTEIASIVSSLTALASSIDAAAKKFIDTVEANPPAFMQQPATAVDLEALADHTIRNTSLVREVAGRINMRTLAEEFGTSDIADEISLSDLAGEISVIDIASHISTSDIASEIDLSDLADEIDLIDLRDKCMEAMSSDIDTARMEENIAREVAENVDAASIAQELDMGDVVRELVDEIDMDELAERMVNIMEGENHDDIADGVACAIMGNEDHLVPLIAAVTKNRDFIAAVAREMAAAMLRGSEAQEPHGARDTFVPASEGPSPEQFNPLQD